MFLSHSINRTPPEQAVHPRVMFREPKTTIIIPCRNEQHHIEEVLESVLTQESPAGGFEVLIVDGMSSDDTRTVIERFVARRGAEFGTSIRVIENPARIVSVGMNLGIRAARGDAIVRMDAHTQYAQDYVQSCLEVLHRTGADNVGGPARTKADTYTQKAIAAAYHSPFAVGGALFHNVDYEGYVDTVTYGCWKKGVFEQFGYFDEDLVRNQDDEHNLRISRSGGRIYQSPAIKSWYKPRGSLRALFEQYKQYGYWKVRVIQKHRIPASFRHLVPGGFLIYLAVCLLLGFLWRPAIWALALGLSAYAAAVLTASVLTARRAGWILFPMLCVVFPCYHFGYGYGFIMGFCDFVIRRRGPGLWSKELTRGHRG